MVKLNARFCICAVFVISWQGVSHCRAEVITMKNGMQFEGSAGEVNSLGAEPAAGGKTIKQITFVDDGLRRTFVSSIQVQALGPNQQGPLMKVRIPQRVCSSGRRVGGIGAIHRITPFDEFGRRVFSMQGPLGRMDIVQGITEITPTFSKVQGMLGSGCFEWDMRVATSSIPRDTLIQILRRGIRPNNLDDHLQVVRFFLQSERYADARREIERLQELFPNGGDFGKQIQMLRQSEAQRLIREIEQRQEAGQHFLAHKMLSDFPAEGVAGATLIQVREMLKEYDDTQQKAQGILDKLAGHVSDMKEGENKEAIQVLHDEIKSRLDIFTLERMADYNRLADDENLTVDQKVSLAVSGWLLGSGAGDENLAVTTSLIQVREKVREYMNAPAQPARDRIIGELKAMEGSAPSYLAKLIAHMRPPVPTSDDDQLTPGLFKLSTKGLAGDPDINYFVQLPPEYNPSRRYPCVVTLHGSASDARHQIQWWAGTYNEKMKMCLGQAARQGYIIIAPEWTEPHQRRYDYTAREHAAPLYSLRDAAQRFAIDTDRVFLSGHSVGGNAVWDIGLAHPDLWAGVIPIVGNADKYVPRYWENGRLLPMYFVGGQLDGGWMAKNGPELDRYLTKHTFDCTVVEYLGRGHEHFNDEIQRIFEWMNNHERNFYPNEFKTLSMRPWDNYFWWVELDQLPPQSIVAPALWPPARGVRPVTTECRILSNNRVSVSTSAGRATVWLSPDMVDFEKRVTVTFRRRSKAMDVQPDTEVLLEDVRTRGDRQHPFWAKVES